MEVSSCMLGQVHGHITGPQKEVCFQKQYLEKEAERGKGKPGFGKIVSYRQMTAGRQSHRTALLCSTFFHHGGNVFQTERAGQIEIA